MRLHLVALVVLGSACAGTIEGVGGGGSDGPDAAVGGGGGGGGSNAATPDAGGSAFACRNPIAAVGSGQHHPAEDCMQGCHNHGFTMAGTLFNGATPVIGGSVTVVDANGKTFDMVTQRNGNFYSKTAVAFPVTVTASSCPDVKPMVSSIAAGNGGCNKSGCHAAGATGSIHLP